ncbi:MAG: 4-alpha-glucanotransferase [Prevotellaceae bacterium]|nr:4-alpha-glucanotransferase [Prevotellaceae bacterium]
MTLHFHLEYETIFGEEVMLNLVGNDGVKTHRMATFDGKDWFCDLRLSKTDSTLTYYYNVTGRDNNNRNEWQIVKHVLDLTCAKATEYTIYDHWNGMPEDSYLYSSAFTDCINHQEPEQMKDTTYAQTLQLTVRAPQLRDGERLAVIGAHPSLGAWNPDKALPMTLHTYGEWAVNIDASVLHEEPVELKFVIMNTAGHVMMWECGYNRTITLPDMRKNQVVVYHLNQAFFEIWNRKVAGTLVPVFSLRSKESAGIGDFGDLKMMIDLMEKTGQRVLQLLPINDTTITHTWTDSYPYSCISVFAIHPQYVNLRALPALADEKERKEAEAEGARLNALPQIDYEGANAFKSKYLQKVYLQEGKKIMKSAEFKAFFQETQNWLVPYAQYSWLRDLNGTADFTKWKDHNTWDEAERKTLEDPRSKEYQEVAFYYFVQFVLSTQMKEAHEYAKQKGVILKGDIPIGVNRYSCDVWTEPKYFNLNGQAGAPPDGFSANGQNWGFPTYNWEEMIKDGCQWWVRRFQSMSMYFDAYRIDHVLGFFRIWEIPIHSVHGLTGQFAPSQAMSREEIMQYGLNFQEQRFTEPFITDWVLDRVFHERADEVRQTYLERIDHERYRMKPEVDTQRNIEARFENVTRQEDLWLRDGLYSLLSDVLFVRDHNNPDMFHPRISAQLDFIYESLYDNDKQAFNRLYNDYYYHRNNQFWYREAMKKLPKLVQATRMLVCAEDLGMVPDCVPWVMDELKILSLELQSMPKSPTMRFGDLNSYPYRSVCTISSHDMPTLRQWWDEDYSRTQDYYNTMLGRQDAAPHPLPGELAKEIIARHLDSPSMLCILSIQDWLAMDEQLRLPDADAERINIPANPKHYWRYRMHLNIEDMIANTALTDTISTLIRQAGRS